MSNEPRARAAFAESHGRQAGIETVMTLLLADHFTASPDPDAASRRWLALIEAMADETDFRELGDPALSDLATQGFRDAAVRLLLRARALATSEPFDPARYRGSFRAGPDRP